ncbi:hypothetical protein DL95DRAFT_404706 [Leptodontidium sp. 2 PMI_412]|nr:hypothetical protein DL95DRAFT_404706 [Leptodontidium sp. 2 PMI_412]
MAASVNNLAANGIRLAQVAIDQVTYDAMIYRGSRQASEMGLMTVTALADWRGPPNPHITANGPANGTQVSYYEGTQGQAVGVPAPTPCTRCTLQFWRDGRPRPRAGTFHTCKIVPGQQTHDIPGSDDRIGGYKSRNGDGGNKKPPKGNGGSGKGSSRLASTAH